MRQTDASSESNAFAPDMFVVFAGKDGGMDSSARFTARSHLLVASSVVNTMQKTIQLRVLNPTER